MRKTFLFTILACSLFLNIAHAETPAEALARYRADYPTPMDTAAHVAELLNRVAWDFRDQGMKLLGKETGANCPLPNGVLISCDYLVHGPTLTGHDVFRDSGPGGPTEPRDFTWGPGAEPLAAAIASGARTLVEPLNPGGVVVVPPVVVPPGPAKPTVAVALSPANQQADLPVSTSQVTWSSNGDTYDLYFGPVNPPPAVATGLAAKAWDTGQLQSGTIYFWRVDARNVAGVTAGPVWSFATVIVPPVEPPPVVEPPSRKLTWWSILGAVLAALYAYGQAR